MPKLLLLIVGCACWAAAVATPALAGDANSVPPTVTLYAAGPEDLVGPRSEALVWFSTEGPDPKPGAEYMKGSKVKFSCSLDGRPIRCPSEHLEAVEIEGFSLRDEGRGGRILSSPFDGRVPIPRNLSPGPHTVTVVATDEDGTDPSPPSATVTFDSVPPSAPLLEDRPPPRSRQHKPVFRFSASDDVRLVRKWENNFTVSLRRLYPSPFLYRKGAVAGSFEWGLTECPTLLLCSARAAAYYSGWGNGVSFGIRERLPAGLYEFRGRSRDAVGNKSPLTTYRFRILPGPPKALPQTT